MKKLTVEVVQEQKDENISILMGGYDSNPTWEEYLDLFNDEARPRLELIKEYIEKSDWIYKITAEYFCNDNHFRFSDGKEISFTWRAWGDLMQAIVGKREGYMAYYM
jgi:hypothetical protein